MGDSIAAQFSLVWSVPIPFIVTVIVVAGLIWKALDYKYGATIERLRSRLEAAEDRLNAPTQQPVDATPASPPVVRAFPDPAVKLRRDRNKAWTDFQGVAEATQKLLVTPFPVQALFDQQALVAQATLLSMHKAFGMPIPEPRESSRGTLVQFMALYRKVKPLLDRDHVEEANRTAVEFIEKSRGAAPDA